MEVWQNFHQGRGVTHMGHVMGTEGERLEQEREEKWFLSSMGKLEF